MAPMSTKRTQWSFAFSNHALIFAWSNSRGKGLFKTNQSLEQGKKEGGGEGWVSRDRGLDPCHYIFPNSIWHLQNGLSHQGSSRRNLGLLWCHRGYALGNLGLLQLNGATVAVLLRHFPEGPGLGPIAIKDLQNKHK